MNVPLPLPNPQDWLNGLATAELLGVSVQTLNRWVYGEAPILRPYYATGSRWPMYWRDEVESLRAARNRAKGLTHART